MAQLIHIRQRMNAIETIKKITHAMRLISMSTHSKLNRKKNNLLIYKDSFQDLYKKIIGNNNPSNQSEGNKTMVILVGSQKGLCGNFNTQLFKYFNYNHKFDDSLKYIAVGKYSMEYLKDKNIDILKSYDKFSHNNFVDIANEIADNVLYGKYNKIVFYSNYSKSFFVQVPKTTNLNIDSSDNINEELISNFIIEGSKSELVKAIKRNILVTSIQSILFESLLSEQAARFLSMDTATRNASNLLEEMSRTYNKLRQSYITQELAELVSSY